MSWSPNHSLSLSLGRRSACWMPAGQQKYSSGLTLRPRNIALGSPEAFQENASHSNSAILAALVTSNICTSYLSKGRLGRGFSAHCTRGPDRVNNLPGSHRVCGRVRAPAPEPPPRTPSSGSASLMLSVLRGTAYPHGTWESDSRDGYQQGMLMG